MKLSKIYLAIYAFIPFINYSYASMVYEDYANSIYGVEPHRIIANASGNGGDANNISSTSIKKENFDIQGGVVSDADMTSLNKGGIDGFEGGGSIFGGLSAGGAAGESVNTSTNGGNGGDIYNNNIELKNGIIRGSKGGNGEYIMDGGAGIGGLGGGSILGGYSKGGAAGSSYEKEANGGNAGHIHNNTISIDNIEIFGGNGGISSLDQGGGGLSGNGGGSVFGGLSLAGAGGISGNNRSYTGQAGFIHFGGTANGGNGGGINNNLIIIKNSNITGGKGAYSSDPYLAGGGAPGGLGGGSVFGGVSGGGAGGSAEDYNVNGGNGGDVYNNKLIINNTEINGGDGGSGGFIWLSGGPGAGGLGGGLVVGGMSFGGTGGFIDNRLNVASANGGNGGSVFGNEIYVNDLNLVGGSAGNGGEAAGIHAPDGLNGGSIFGGISLGGSASQDTYGAAYIGGNGGDVLSNRITISGASIVNGDVFGGYSRGGRDSLNLNISQGGTVNNNYITLVGENVEISGSIYGGKSLDGLGNENFERSFRGNTLQLQEYRGSVQGVANIENYIWVLPENTSHNDEIMQIKGSNPVELTGTKHSVYLTKNGSRLNNGDQITLMTNANGNVDYKTPTLQQGHFIVYDSDLKVENNNLLLSIKDTYINPKSKTLLEGNLSGLMLLTRSEDTLSDQLLSTIDNQNNKRGLVPFVLISGNHSRYDTSSDIKSNGGLITAGLSYQNDFLTSGVFLENGWDTYKILSNADDISSAQGHNRFYGLGFYSHYIFNNGFYLDGTARLGRLHTNFETTNLENSQTDHGMAYDINGNYYGLTLKGGYLVSWNNQNDLDFSAKYTWAGTQSHNVNIDDERVHFNKLNSERLILKAENSYDLNPEFQLLSGLGYEYEFSATAKGKALDVFDIEEQSVKGSTGVVSLGVQYMPKVYENLSMSLNTNGYFGKREGGSATLQVNYKF